jgi:S-adenosylmethionine hydrolase
VHGEVVHVDRFGNLITNIAAAALASFRPHSLSVRIAGMTLSPLAPTYAAVAPGAPVALIGSWRTLEVAVRDGNAAEQLRVGLATPVSVIDSLGPLAAGPLPAGDRAPRNPRRQRAGRPRSQSSASEW